MGKAWLGATVFASVLIATGGESGSQARAQYSRRTPIVEAVQKTCMGVVTVRVEKKNSWDRTRETEGTGVVVDEHGYVITNRHLVATATKVRIVLGDGTELAAQVVAEEPRGDLAILRIPSDKKLQALPLGPGSDLLVGETVIAVGHPYGYSHTVSTGIISAVDRRITLTSGETLSNIIQTNASINPGNSGGPLLNINGELIGIICGMREGAQGIAFAINADTVKQMLLRHLSAVKIAGVHHGLTCSERVLPEGPRRQRVIVARVTDKTPAALAGVQGGDELLRVADCPVANRFDVERALWDRQPGESVSLTVFRKGKEISIALTLATGTEEERSAASPSVTAESSQAKVRPALMGPAQDHR
jgi:serine protease Do